MTPTSHWSKLDVIVNEQETATELARLPPTAAAETPAANPTNELEIPGDDFSSPDVSMGFELSDARLSDIVEGEQRLSDLSLAELSRHGWEQVVGDYGNFYSPGNLTNLAIGFGAGAVLANTSLDESISHDLFRENVVEIANEDITQKLHSPKPLGDGHIILPIVGGAALAQPWLEESPWLEPLGDWGNRAARTVLVGGPFVLATQRLIGGSRPTESHSQSHWEPFQDNNGVSGHAFVGAVPFLAAAQMSDSKVAKALWITGSVLPGLSRVNDDRHYFSQVFLGWYVAFLATQAVDQTQHASRGFRLMPLLAPNGFGFAIEKRF